MKSSALIFLFLIAFYSHAQYLSIQWQKCYGGTFPEEGGLVIKQQPNGRFIVGCDASSNDGDVSGNHGFEDYWLVQIDSAGNLVRQKCFGGSAEEWLSSIVLEQNGSYVVAGTTGSTNGDVLGNHSSSADIWVFNCDSLGAIQWQKCLGGSDQDYLNSMIKTYDEGYIFIGYSRSNDFDVIGHHDSTVCYPCEDIWVVKTDSIGTIQWSKCYGGTWNDEGISIIQMADSGYVFASLAMSYDGDVQGLHALEDLWIVKIDSIGNIQWQKCLGGTGREIPNVIKLTMDNGFIVIGNASSFDFDVTGFHGPGENIPDVWIIKLDSVGDLQWQKCLGGTNTDVGNNILQLSDSSYLAMCMTASVDGDLASNPASGSDVWFIKLSSQGNLEWQQLMGGSFDDAGFDILQSSDNGFIFSGGTFSNDGDVSGNHGYDDVWVVKLSPLSNSISEKNHITDFSTYFNNVSSDLHLKYYANGNENFQMKLMDITGQIILQQEIKASPGFNEKSIHVGQHASGIYLVRFETRDGFVTKKIVIN